MKKVRVHFLSTTNSNPHYRDVIVSEKADKYDIMTAFEDLSLSECVLISKIEILEENLLVFKLS